MLPVNITWAYSHRGSPAGSTFITHHSLRHQPLILKSRASLARLSLPDYPCDCAPMYWLSGWAVLSSVSPQRVKPKASHSQMHSLPVCDADEAERPGSVCRSMCPTCMHPCLHHVPHHVPHMPAPSPHHVCDKGGSGWLQCQCCCLTPAEGPGLVGVRADGYVAALRPADEGWQLGNLGTRHTGGEIVATSMGDAAAERSGLWASCELWA